MTGGATSDLASNKSHLANKLNFSAQIGKDTSCLFPRAEIETTPSCAKELLKCDQMMDGESSTPATDKSYGLI